MLESSSVTEPKAVSDVVKFDLQDYSRESVTIASGNGIISIGEVLGLITASDKHAKYDNAAIDGTEVAVAVSRVKVDSTAADVTGVPVDVRVCTVILGQLVFDAGQDQTAQDAGIVDLKAAGFKVTTEIC